MSSAVKIAAGLAFAAMAVEVTRQLKAVARLICESPYDALHDTNAAVEAFVTRSASRAFPRTESRFDRPPAWSDTHAFAA